MNKEDVQKKRKGYKPKVPRKSSPATKSKKGEEKWTEMFSRSLSTAIDRNERGSRRATSSEVAKKGSLRRSKHSSGVARREEKRASCADSNLGVSARDMNAIRTDVVPGTDPFTAGTEAAVLMGGGCGPDDFEAPDCVIYPGKQIGANACPDIAAGAGCEAGGGIWEYGTSCYCCHRFDKRFSERSLMSTRRASRNSVTFSEPQQRFDQEPRDYQQLLLQPNANKLKGVPAPTAFEKWQDMKEHKASTKKRKASDDVTEMPTGAYRRAKKKRSTTINERIVALAARGLLCREMLFNNGSDD
jgi:hypothetical protein